MSVLLIAVIGIGVLSLIFFSTVKVRRNYQARHGTSNERRDIGKTGLGPLAQRTETNRAQAERAKKVTKNIKKETPNKTAERNTAKVVAREAKITENLAIAQERTEGMLAEVAVVEQAIEEYIESEQQDNNIINAEAHNLEQLENQIANEFSHESINARTLAHLHTYADHISTQFESATQTQKKREVHIERLLEHINDAISNIKNETKSLSIEENKIKSFEKKEKREYRRAIKTIQKKLKTTKKDVKRAKRKSKSNITSNLGEEHALLEKQVAFCTRVHKQTAQTFSMIEQEVRSLRKKSRSIKKINRTLAKNERKSKKIEDRLDSARNKLYTACRKWQKEIKKLEKEEKMHQFAVQLANGTSIFLNKSKDIGITAYAFDQSLKQILSSLLLISKDAEIYTRTLASIEQTVPVLNQAFQVLEKTLKAISETQEMKQVDDELENVLQGLDNIIEQQQQSTRELDAFAKAIMGKISSVEQSVDRMTQQDTEIIRALELASEHIGQILGTAVNRRVQVDTEYLGTAQQITEQMAQRNQIAAQSFQNTRR